MLNIVTTWLEIVGLVLIAAAAGLQVGSWSVPGGLAMSGLVLIGESAVVGLRSRPKPGQVEGVETA